MARGSWAAWFWSQRVLFVIATSGIGAGLIATELNNTRTNSIAMTRSNTILFVCLLCELLGRVAVQRKKFATKGWNLVAVVVLIAWMPVYGEETPYGLRAVILLRVLQYAMGYPKLRTLVYGTMSGLKMMCFIVLCLVLLVYIYAIIGLALFRTNDPWHFGDLQRSMTTLFRVSTLEDWTEVFYVNYFGCEVFTAGIYLQGFKNNPCVAHEGLDNALCTQPEAKRLLSVVFFCTFILMCISLFAMFIGALCIKLSEAVKVRKHNPIVSFTNMHDLNTAVVVSRK